MDENRDIFSGSSSVGNNHDGNISADELFKVISQLQQEISDLKRLQDSENKADGTTCGDIGELKELVAGVLVPLLGGISQLGTLGALGALGNLGQLGNLGRLGGLGNLGQLPQLEQLSSAITRHNVIAAHNLSSLNCYPSLPGFPSFNQPSWPY